MYVFIDQFVRLCSFPRHLLSVRLVGNLSKDFDSGWQSQDTSNLSAGVSPRLFCSWQMAANQMCQPSAVCHLTLVLSPARWMAERPEIRDARSERPEIGVQLETGELEVQLQLVRATDKD